MARRWTSDQRETVAWLFDEAGQSAGQIAKLFGVSRNAICGLLHRMEMRRG